MSHTIEYKRIAFMLPEGSTEITNNPIYPEDNAAPRISNDYYLFVQQGANNVSPRPKEWGLISTGWNYSVIQKVCERAGATEGGGIQISGKRTSPENYLRLYRKTLSEAQPLTLEALKNTMGIYELCVPYVPVNIQETLTNNAKYHPNSHQQLLVNMMQDQYKSKPEYYNEKALRYSRPLNTLEDFNLWLRLRSLNDLVGRPYFKSYHNS